MPGTSCATCALELPDDLPGQKPPCPKCGSTKRSHSADVSEGIGLHNGLRLKALKPELPSAKKLRFDTYVGVEKSHKHGRLVRVERTIDKDNDRYIERVVDLQTGELLHECDEPLSQHINHGTAKGRSGP